MRKRLAEIALVGVGLGIAFMVGLRWRGDENPSTSSRANTEERQSLKQDLSTRIPDPVSRPASASQPFKANVVLPFLPSPVPRPKFDSKAASRDEAYIPILKRQISRGIELHFGDALRALGLPNDKLDELRNLLVNRDTSLIQFEAILEGTTASKEEVAKARQAAIQDVETAIENLIGVDVYRDLKSARKRSGALRVPAYDAGADLSIAGVPLSDDQLQALAVIYDQRKPLTGGTDPETGLPPDLQKMYTAAKDVLKPQQLGIFLATLQSKVTSESYIAGRLSTKD